MGLNLRTTTNKAIKAFDERPGLKLAVAVVPMVWTQARNIATYLLTQDMRFNSTMEDYDAIARFVSQTIIDQRFSRTFGYAVEHSWNGDDGEQLEYHGLSLGYGKHYGRYRGVLVRANRFMSDNDRGPITEHLDLTFLTRDKAVISRFAEDVRLLVGESKTSAPTVSIFINNEAYWSRMGKLPLRPMASVITRGNIGEAIVAAIREFEASRDEHHAMGLPHHMGIMLEGEPGCGKSSLLHAIASATGRSIHYLNLGSVTKDSELTGLLSGARDWTKALLAIEDIDVAGVNVNRDETATKSPVSLSALLNSLDGMLCPDGLIVIATTNHHEALDAALRREGRFDHTFKIGRLNYTDFVQMAATFKKDPAHFAMQPGDEMTGAAMRAMLLGHD